MEKITKYPGNKKLYLFGGKRDENSAKEILKWVCLKISLHIIQIILGYA